MWMNHWRAPTDVPVRCGPVVHETESGCLRGPVDYLTVANRVLEARFLPDTTVYDTHCTSFGRRPD